MNLVILIVGYVCVIWIIYNKCCEVRSCDTTLPSLHNSSCKVNSIPILPILDPHSLNPHTHPESLHNGFSGDPGVVAFSEVTSFPFLSGVCAELS